MQLAAALAAALAAVAAREQHMLSAVAADSVAESRGHPGSVKLTGHAVEPRACEDAVSKHLFQQFFSGVVLHGGPIGY